VGGAIKLTAATGIGAESEATDIDTTANTIDAATGSGSIYLKPRAATSAWPTTPSTTPVE